MGRYDGREPSRIFVNGAARLRLDDRDRATYRQHRARPHRLEPDDNTATSTAGSTRSGSPAVARSASWIQTEYNNQANQGVGAGKFILNATTEGASARLKLVQSGSVTIGAAATTATATLNPVVDMTKSFLVFGVSENLGDPDDGQVTGRSRPTNTGDLPAGGGRPAPSPSSGTWRSS